MTEPDGEGPDPVFNDYEREVPLPIGDGETISEREFLGEDTVPEGGESTSTGGILRQMGRVLDRKSVV